MNAFIERIQEINPILNCVVADRFDDARKDAQKVDEIIKSGTIPIHVLEKEKPFFGVPFTTKDCIAVKGRIHPFRLLCTILNFFLDMIHTAGLHKRKDIKASEDADAIAFLRQAGAIPLALTNISELCMW